MKVLITYEMEDIVKWLLVVVCAFAAGTDILWRRIPKVWLESWFLTGLLVTGLLTGGLPLGEGFCKTGSEWAVLFYLLRAGIVFGCFYFPWRIRFLGAGDVKLCCVLAGWLGGRTFLFCFIYGLFLGAAMAFGQMVLYRSFRQRFSYFLAWIGQVVSEKRWLPYDRGTGYEKKNTIPFSMALLCSYLFWCVQRG